MQKAADAIIGGDIRDVAGCTCLRLRRTTRRATQIYDRALASADITITQLGLLGYLHGASSKGAKTCLSVSWRSAWAWIRPPSTATSIRPAG